MGDPRGGCGDASTGPPRVHGAVAGDWPDAPDHAPRGPGCCVGLRRSTLWSRHAATVRRVKRDDGRCRAHLERGPTSSPTPEGVVPAAGQGGFVVQEADREAHLSAKRPSARQAPRVPAPDVGSRRPGGIEKPSAQGPPPTVGLIWRVRDRRTMLDLRRSGTRVRSGTVTVTHLAPPGPNDDPPRVAFAIGRRVGPAVVRNRVRRRLRSILRGLADDPAQLPRGAYLVSVQPKAVTSTYAQLEQDVRRSLAKIVSSGGRVRVVDGANLVS